MSAELALQALKQIPGWSKSADIQVRGIGNGNTSTSWIVERDGQSFVLRVDSPVASKLGLNRANEMVVRAHVSAAGIAPRVIYTDLAEGILLSEYVSGCPWQSENVQNEQNLVNLAQTLKQLYSLPTVGVAFDPADALTHYAKHLEDDASLDCVQEALALLKTTTNRTTVLCHNDLVAENIVSGEQLWLIDWEYAGVGDPLFDLAVVVEHHDVDKRLALQFVEMSLGCMNRQIARDLSTYGQVYRHLVTLWSAIV